MRTLIIGDIHLKHEEAQKIINSVSFDKIIFGGDFFDNWNDTPFQNRLMAEWVKTTIHTYNCDVLLSNHDIAYRYPDNYDLVCSGFSKEKSKEINSVLTKEDWKKFKPITQDQGFIFTHAGISLRLYDYICSSLGLKTVKKQDLVFETISQEIPKAMQLCEDKIAHPLFLASFYRGGLSRIPGINWCDYAELIPIMNTNQIFFHTPHQEVYCKTMRAEGQISNWKADHYLQNTDYDIRSFNYDMDTHLKFYSTITDGLLEVFSSETNGKNILKKTLIMNENSIQTPKEPVQEKVQEKAQEVKPWPQSANKWELGRKVIVQDLFGKNIKSCEVANFSPNTLVVLKAGGSYNTFVKNLPVKVNDNVFYVAQKNPKKKLIGLFFVCSYSEAKNKLTPAAPATV